MSSSPRAYLHVSTLGFFLLGVHLGAFRELSTPGTFGAQFHLGFWSFPAPGFFRSLHPSTFWEHYGLGILGAFTLWPFWSPPLFGVFWALHCWAFLEYFAIWLFLWDLHCCPSLRNFVSGSFGELHQLAFFGVHHHAALDECITVLPWSSTLPFGFLGALHRLDFFRALHPRAFPERSTSVWHREWWVCTLHWYPVCIYAEWSEAGEIIWKKCNNL